MERPQADVCIGGDASFAGKLTEATDGCVLNHHLSTSNTIQTLTTHDIYTRQESKKGFRYPRASLDYPSLRLTVSEEFCRCWSQQAEQT